MSNPDAAYYNKVKNIVFSTYYNSGTLAAYEMLYNYQGKLPQKGWYGLKAELDFYSKYQSKYQLTASLDRGILSDFTGMIDKGKLSRIDVTTNCEVKRLKKYEPLMDKDGMNYKIIVMNKDTGVIEDIVDLGFPADASGEGKMFNIALFMPMDYNDHGEPRYNYYQKIISIGSSNPADDNVFIEDSTDWYFQDIASFYQDMPEDYVEAGGEADLTEYLASAAHLLSKTTGKMIVACGQVNAVMTDPKECEYDYITKLYWQHPLIEGYLDDTIYADLSELY